MAFVPLTNGIKLCFNFTLQNVPVSVCLHVRVDSAVNQGQVDETVSVAKTWWEGSGCEIFSQDLQIVSIVATDVSQRPGYQSTEDSFTNTNGTIMVESLPNGSAIVVTTLSGFIGRSFRGRMFLPGIDVNAVELNTLTVGAKANIGSRLSGLINALNAAGQTPVVASYQQDGVLRTTAVGTPITSLQVRDNVKSQRRRNLPG